MTPKKTPKKTQTQTQKRKARKLKRAAIEAGRRRFWARQQQAIERGVASETAAAKRLLANTLPDLVGKVGDWLEEVKARPGPRHAAATFLRDMPAELIAYTAIRAAFDSALAQPQTLASVAAKVGAMLEAEACILFYLTLEPELVTRLNGRLDKMAMSSFARRYRFLRKEVESYLREEGRTQDLFPCWGVNRRRQVGLSLAYILAEHTALFEIFGDTTRRGTQMFGVTEAANRWVAKFNHAAELLRPVRYPYAEPPEAWTAERLTEEINRLEDPLAYPFIRHGTKSQLKRLAESPEIGRVLDACNALQNTAWRVNKEVEKWLRLCVDNRYALGGIPQLDPLPLPPKPEDIATNPHAKRQWKAAAGKVHTLNARREGRQRLLTRIIGCLDVLKGVERFYFPYSVDFRGRFYPETDALSPQGNDISRSLLEFAEGKPIETEEQAGWLAFHVANCYGLDKVSLEDRVAWVKANHEMLCSVAADPIHDHRWAEADSPWQFLRAAIEWLRFCETGFGFVSHLPIAVDGTCNGLQILSLLSRDELVAEQVNVRPSDAPRDIYGAVAERVVEALKAEVDPERKAMADFWLSVGIDRKTTKRQVMVVPYGGTLTSCRAYTREWYLEQVVAKGLDPFAGNPEAEWKHIVYLSDAIWGAMSAFLGRSKGVMTWLSECSKVVAEKCGELLAWSTPSGFVVEHRYRKTALKQVESLVDKRKVRVAFRDDTPKPDFGKSRQAIAPNYVHSLDAAALVYTINYCSKVGVEAFAAIHDSYGTHAADMDKLATALRTTFAVLFESDLLAEAKEAWESSYGVTLPELPDYGRLDPSVVMQSTYFFA